MDAGQLHDCSVELLGKASRKCALKNGVTESENVIAAAKNEARPVILGQTSSFGAISPDVEPRMKSTRTVCKVQGASCKLCGKWKRWPYVHMIMSSWSTYDHWIP